MGRFEKQDQQHQDKIGKQEVERTGCLATCGTCRACQTEVEKTKSEMGMGLAKKTGSGPEPAEGRKSLFSFSMGSNAGTGTGTTGATPQGPNPVAAPQQTLVGIGQRQSNGGPSPGADRIAQAMANFNQAKSVEALGLRATQSGSVTSGNQNIAPAGGAKPAPQQDRLVSAPMSAPSPQVTITSHPAPQTATSRVTFAVSPDRPGPTSIRSATAVSEVAKNVLGSARELSRDMATPLASRSEVRTERSSASRSAEESPRQVRETRSGSSTSEVRETRSSSRTTSASPHQVQQAVRAPDLGTQRAVVASPSSAPSTTQTRTAAYVPTSGVHETRGYETRSEARAAITHPGTTRTPSELPASEARESSVSAGASQRQGMPDVVAKQEVGRSLPVERSSANFEGRQEIRGGTTAVAEKATTRGGAVGMVREVGAEREVALARTTQSGERTTIVHRAAPDRLAAGAKLDNLRDGARALRIARNLERASSQTTSLKKAGSLLDQVRGNAVFRNAERGSKMLRSLLRDANATLRAARDTKSSVRLSGRFRRALDDLMKKLATKLRQTVRTGRGRGSALEQSTKLRQRSAIKSRSSLNARMAEKRAIKSAEPVRVKLRAQRGLVTQERKVQRNAEKTLTAKDRRLLQRVESDIKALQDLQQSILRGSQRTRNVKISERNAASVGITSKTTLTRKKRHNGKKGEAFDELLEEFTEKLTHTSAKKEQKAKEQPTNAQPKQEEQIKMFVSASQGGPKKELDTVLSKEEGDSRFDDDDLPEGSMIQH